MRLNRLVAAAALYTFCLGAVFAREDAAPVYPVEAFAKLPQILSPQISPDGKSIAYLTAVTSGRKTLVAHPIKGSRKNRSFSLPHLESADISRFRWVSDDRVLVTYSFFTENFFYAPFPIEQSRLFSVSLSGDVFNAVKPSFEQDQVINDKNDPLSTRSKVAVAQIQSRIVDLLHDDPNHILLALDENLDGDPSVRKINVTNGSFDIVQGDSDNIARWMTNASGEPVLGWSDYEENPRVVIRGDERDIWSREAILALIEAGAYPMEIQDDNITAIFSALNATGRRALGRFDLRTGDLVEWLFSNERYDFEAAYRSHVTGRLSGAYYVDTQSRQVLSDDPEKRILRIINKLFPDAANRIISSDKAGSFFLIASSAPQETPKIFAFNPEAKTLALFANNYSAIDDAHVAPVSRHTVEMRDGLEIDVYITTPIGRGDAALPTVLLPHGGPTSRDSADFNWEAQMLANRGHRVLQPNFRGSSGYGAAFEILGHGQWGRKMQDDLEDTMRWAIAQGLSDDTRSCIVGGSYGGYAALMAAVATPDLFRCAVSINGVADMEDFWTDQDQWKGGEEWRKPIGDKRRDTKDISPYRRADEIKIPVLLIHAKDDARIDFRQSKDMYKRLKRNKTPVKYLELESGGHSIDADAQRIKYNKALVAFLNKYIGDGS